MSDVLGDPLTAVIAVFAYPAYVLVMSVVLLVVGVPRADVAIWALRQAGRQRLTDLVKAARALPESSPADEASDDVAPSESPQGGANP